MKGIKGLLMKGLLILIILFLVFLGNEAMGNGEYDKYERIYEIIKSSFDTKGFVPAFVKYKDCVFVLVARREIPIMKQYAPYTFEYLIVEDNDVRGVCILIKK